HPLGWCGAAPRAEVVGSAGGPVSLTDARQLRMVGETFRHPIVTVPRSGVMAVASAGSGACNHASTSERRRALVLSDARLARMDDAASAASSASENPCAVRAISYWSTSREPNRS